MTTVCHSTYQNLEQIPLPVQFEHRSDVKTFSDFLKSDPREQQRKRDGYNDVPVFRLNSTTTTTTTTYVKGGNVVCKKRLPLAQRKHGPGLNNITMTKLHSVSISLAPSELPYGQLPNRFHATLSRKQFNSYLTRSITKLRSYSQNVDDVSSSFVQPLQDASGISFLRL